MLCEYGCGQEAVVYFKYAKKWCCSKNWSSCLANRKKISNSGKRAWEDAQKRENIRDGIKEAMNRSDIKKRHSEKMKKTWQDPVKRKNMVDALKELQNRPGIKERNSKTNKDTWRNKTDQEKEEFLSKIFKSNERKPNKTEILVTSIIETSRPNEFKYVGNGQVWIAGKCPDWINVNGKKQVIEYFSNYWHKKEDEELRKSHFKKYGFDCLVIWQDELNDKGKSVV